MIPLLTRNHPQDIKSSNVLINHIGRYDQVAKNPLRRRLRSEHRALYAIIDFDCSIMFPRTSTPSERRLPARDSLIIGGNYTYDTAQGELDYDPFAYDVGALGQHFCEMFQVRDKPLSPRIFFNPSIIMTVLHPYSTHVGPAFQ